MRKLCLLSFLVLLAIPALTQTFPPKIHLLETGSFHGDEVKVRSGEKLLGLYIDRRGSSLISTTVRVRRVVDEIVDEQPGQMTGKDVSVATANKPVFLIKNADMLKEGPVTTVYRGSKVKRHELMSMYEDWKGGKTVSLKLGEQSYRLKVVGRQRELTGESQGQKAFDLKVLLTDGKITQTLYSIKDNVESRPWHLVWAGDADGDGKLDLYLDLSWHYNGSESLLFLSSQAKSGQLVKEIARFHTVGC
jgi:hypothetical protein